MAKLRIRVKPTPTNPPVAPTFTSPVTASIDTGYANGDVVATVLYTNTPSPTPTPSITSGNTNSTFSIEAITGGFRILVANSANLSTGTPAFTLGVQASNTGGTASGSIAVNISAVGSDTLIWTQTITNDGASTASGQRIRFTLGQMGGTPPSIASLEARKSNGTTAYARQQFDASVSDSGHIFVVCTVEQEDDLAAGASDTIKVYSTSSSVASNTSSITDQNIKDLNYTYEVVAGGTTYTFDPDDAFTAGDNDNFAIGPVERQVRVWGLAKNGSTANQALFVEGWISLLRNGTTSAAWFDLISHWSENYTSRTAAGTGTITAIRIKKNGVTVKEYTPSTTKNLKGGAAVACCDSDYTAVWSTNKPTIRPVYTVAQQHAAGLIPNMTATSGILAAISVTPPTYTPFNTLSLGTALNGGGGRPDIGWMTGWTAQYAVKQDKNTAQQARGYALATDYIQKRFYTSSTGANLVARNETYGTVVGNVNIGNSVGSNVISYLGGDDIFTGGNDTFHWPAAVYYPYVATGEPWFLARVIAEASHTLLASSQGFRTQTHTNGDSQTSVIRYDGGARGFAWGFNIVANANWVCPDNHLLRDFIDDLYADNKNWLNSINKTANMDDNCEALGFMRQFQDSSSGTGGLGVQYFMWGYLGNVTGMEALRGQFSASDAYVTMGLTKNIIGSHVNGCLSRASAYTMNFTHQNGTSTSLSNVAQSWANVGLGVAGTWDDNHKLIPSGGCPASGVQTATGGLHDQHDAHNYPNIFSCAAHMWAQFGISSADTMRDYLDANGVTMDDADWASKMQWRVRH